jgi:hypothetical protein
LGGGPPRAWLGGGPPGVWLGGGPPGMSLGTELPEPVEVDTAGPDWLGMIGDELDDPVSLGSGGDGIDDPVSLGSIHEELDDPESLDADELDADELDDELSDDELDPELDDPESPEPPDKGTGSVNARGASKDSAETAGGAGNGRVWAFAIPVPSPRRLSSMPLVIAAPANNCFVLKVRLLCPPLQVTP